MVENTEKTEEIKQQAKEDAEKAGAGKKIVRAGKMPPRPIPQVVLNEARAQGGHVIYLEDNDGNRMHLIRIGRRTASVMTERNGQEPSSPLSAKIPEVKKVLNQARVEVSNPKSDMSKIIDSFEEMQKVPMPEPINQQHISVQDLKNMKEFNSVKTPEISGKVDLSLNPEVRVVPKLKKNGEFSKKNFNIQLMDADGKVYTLTKKMVKEAAKYNDSTITSNGKVVEHEKRTIEKWDKYVKLAEEGKLSAKDVAQFFNNYGNGPNLGAKNAKAEEKVATPTTQNNVKEAPSKNVTPNSQSKSPYLYDWGAAAATQNSEKSFGVGIPVASASQPKKEQVAPTVKPEQKAAGKLDPQQSNGVEVGIPGAYRGLNLNKKGAPTVEQTQPQVVKANVVKADNTPEVNVYAKGKATFKDAPAVKPEQKAAGKLDPQQSNGVEAGTLGAYRGLNVNSQGAPAVEQTQVEETTKNVKTVKTVNKTPDGVTYSCNEKGVTSFTGVIGGPSPLISDYLTPCYESYQSSEQVFGANKDPKIKAYEDKNGKFHCGGTMGDNFEDVVSNEKKALSNLVLGNAVYNDLKRKEAKEALGDAEKNFMKAHEKALADRGLIRCPDGVLEYKDCPEKDYNAAAHKRAAAINLSIQRGTAKSETTTIHTGGGNSMVNTNTAGRGGIQ